MGGIRYFHDEDRSLHEAIQGVELQYRVQDLRDAVSVQADQALSIVCRREISVTDTQFISVAHLHENLEEIRGEY